MTATATALRAGLRASAALAAAALGFALSGCADIGDTVSPAFADPARYELYECKQLEPERKRLATAIAEVQGLMAKAETGVGGSVVSELAYRNDYIALRGQQRFAEEAWRKKRCRETPQAVAPAGPPAPPSRAGSAVY
jgi:hypothetical protein